MSYTKEKQRLILTQKVVGILKRLGINNEKCLECKGFGDLRESHQIDSTGHFEICSKCNGIGKISQKEMQKQAQESVAKKEKGKYHLVYKKNKRTIVAEPRGWEWEPRPKDICFDKAGHELIVIGINSRKPWIIEVTEIFEDEINLDSYTICPDEVIPFIPWEKIEKIAKKFGFALGQNDFTDRDGVTTYGAWFNHMGHWTKFGEGKERQTAVTSALLELEKELK